jgi:TolB protein
MAATSFLVRSRPERPTFGGWTLTAATPKQLTNDGGFFPDVSPDGRWVIYTVLVPGEARLWKVSIDGGEPVRLTDNNSVLEVVSPDGKLIAYLP